MKETTKAFFRQLLSVVLGIIITFSLQSTAERIRTRRNVRAALELVRAELVANIDDIDTMSEHLRQERRSAEYFLANRTTINRCPADSVNYHSGILLSDASITLSQDALELMKMSSLFQKIGDNDTAMKIIRAYDTCSSAVVYLNHHIEVRNSLFNQFDSSVSDYNARRLASSNSMFIKELIKTGMGQYIISWLSLQPAPEYYTDKEDILEAISAIDAFIQ